MDQLFAGSVDGLTNDGSAAESASMGYVGRLNFDFLSKYIIEFSGRYDGNDNFCYEVSTNRCFLFDF